MANELLAQTRESLSKVGCCVGMFDDWIVGFRLIVDLELD